MGKETLILMFIKMLYEELLRDLLVKDIQKTATDWDGRILKIADSLLGYEE